MIPSQLIQEDLTLKDLARRDEARPRYNWADLADNAAEPSTDASAIIDHTGEERSFTSAHIAAMLGDALTDLLLARKEREIFTETNQRMVADISHAVSREMAQRLETGGSAAISVADVTRLIERVLVKRQSYDLARSVVNRFGGGFVFAHGGSEATVAPARAASPQEPGLHHAHAPSGPAEPFSLTSAPSGGMCRVIRRNGDVVSWNPQKIGNAVRKAFLGLQMDSAPAEQIAQAVSDRVAADQRTYCGIEEVQDLVQEELMKAGHYKVAAVYVVYRHHRAEARRSAAAEHARRPDTADECQDQMILVKREDGETFLWDGTDLRKRMQFARMGLDLCISGDQIETELRRSLFPEMTLEDLKKTIIINAKVLIQRDADFARFASRILLTYIYEEVLGWDIVRDGVESLKEFHRRAFKTALQRGVEIDRLNPALLDYDLDKLAAALDPAADFDFDFLGIQTLYDRYLIVDKTGKRHRRIETPQLFWMRVAMGLFLNHHRDIQADHVIALYTLYRSRRFCSSTPTLFNAGTNHSQLSSCYLYKVDDSIESIMIRGIAENAFLSKWAGGLGGSWTSVRGIGSYIKGTNGESQGVIPFLKMHNDQLVAVNQGGKRKGSGCAYLEIWHNDIRDFFELRRNVGDERRRTHDLNTANWIPDLFMKRMEKRENWTLFRANEVPDLHECYGQEFERRYAAYEEKAARGEIFSETLPALELWKLMLRMLFETGHPWITFKDPCNLRSPQDHVGVIHSSNLCTEITLNTSKDETAVCNLGSVVLENHLKSDGSIDHEKLRETIRIAVRALDNVIDINFYPTEPARTANLRHRPIGLGVMGLANCLYRRDIPFGSEAAVEFNDEIMEAVAYYAYEASSDLAAERGAYSTFRGSKWDRGLLPQDTVDLLEKERGEPIEVKRGGRMDWTPVRAKIAKQGMRNSNVLAIAPTATISNIVGSCPCIEPHYKNLYVKSNLSGEFTILNEYLVRDLKSRNLWNEEMLRLLKYHEGELAEITEIPEDIKKKYRTAFAIDTKWLIEAAARRQKWIDQSQSLNLFLKTPDLKQLSHMYRHAWRAGLKTTYYLRTLGASSTEAMGDDVTKEVRGVMGDAQPPAAVAAGPRKKDVHLEIACEGCQ